MELPQYIKKRFPNAQFTVSCFGTIEEIETKILCDSREIIVMDMNTDHVQIRKDDKMRGKIYTDYFIVEKRPENANIYYKDVIDALIESDLIRNDGISCNLVNIVNTSGLRRNPNSMPVYKLCWQY
jgi:hypothetical protein